MVRDAECCGCLPMSVRHQQATPSSPFQWWKRAKHVSVRMKTGLALWRLVQLQAPTLRTPGLDEEAGKGDSVTLDSRRQSFLILRLTTR